MGADTLASVPVVRGVPDDGGLGRRPRVGRRGRPARHGQRAGKGLFGVLIPVQTMPFFCTHRFTTCPAHACAPRGRWDGPSVDWGLRRVRADKGQAAVGEDAVVEHPRRGVQQRVELTLQHIVRDRGEFLCDGLDEFLQVSMPPARDSCRRAIFFGGTSVRAGPAVGRRARARSPADLDPSVELDKCLHVRGRVALVRCVRGQLDHARVQLRQQLAQRRRDLQVVEVKRLCTRTHRGPSEPACPGCRQRRRAGPVRGACGRGAVQCWVFGGACTGPSLETTRSRQRCPCRRRYWPCAGFAARVVWPARARTRARARLFVLAHGHAMCKGGA